jgi:hypothetical protein
MSKRPPQFSMHLPAWQKALIYTSFTLLASAGVSWLIFENLIRIEGEFGPERSPWQPWMLTVHGLGCFAFLVAIGTMLPVHVRLGLIGKRSRRSGIATAMIALFMAITGYGLYYIADDGVREWTSTIHWIGGLTTIALLGSHVWLGSRKTKPKRVLQPGRRRHIAPGNDAEYAPELEAAE